MRVRNPCHGQSICFRVLWILPSFQLYKSGHQRSWSALLESYSGRVWPLMHDHPGFGFFSGFGLVCFLCVIKHTKMHRLLFLRKICDTQEQKRGLCWQSPAWSHRICFQHHKSLSKRGPPVFAVRPRFLTVPQLFLYLSLVPTKLRVPGDN